MTNEEIRIDVLGAYDDDIEVQCIDERGSIYSIQGLDNNGGEGNVIFLKLSRLKFKKKKSI